jgi:hypothetical protein
MELLAFGGASTLVWNPRHDAAVHGTCKLFGRRWNPDRRGGSGVGARKMVEARGYNVQEGYDNSETAPSSMNT